MTFSCASQVFMPPRNPCIIWESASRAGGGTETEKHDQGRKAVFPSPDLEFSPESGFSDLRLWGLFWGQARNGCNFPWNALIFLMPAVVDAHANFTDVHSLQSSHLPTDPVPVTRHFKLLEFMWLPDTAMKRWTGQLTKMYQVYLLTEAWILIQAPEAPPNKHSRGITVSIYVAVALGPTSITGSPSAPPTANLFLPHEPAPCKKQEALLLIQARPAQLGLSPGQSLPLSWRPLA